MAFERCLAGLRIGWIGPPARPDGLEVTECRCNSVNWSHRAYNTILEDFCRADCGRRRTPTGSGRTSGSTLQIEDKLSVAAADALRRFNALAKSIASTLRPSALV